MILNFSDQMNMIGSLQWLVTLGRFDGRPPTGQKAAASANVGENASASQRNGGKKKKTAIY